ncbi:MAG: Uncharacterized protein G01um101493_269, partial [Microgenomates group bacterium Gr01-1014_93]
YLFGIFLPPIMLNHPPEKAKIYIRDELFVTFLEEYTYPLKGSVFIAGYEPYIENEMNKVSHFFLGDNIHINGNFYVSKTTLRLYPANPIFQLLVYIGVWFSSICLYKLWRKVHSG